MCLSPNFLLFFVLVSCSETASNYSYGDPLSHFPFQRRGFSNVTVFERSNRVGGKSLHVEHRGTVNALTTAIMWPGSPIR